MSRAYLRLDPDFAERKADYPDGPYRALVDTLCLAEFQPHRGHFRSERILRALLGRSSRWVPYLIAHGDLSLESGGRLYVEGWDEWQEGDVTVRERVARIRKRRARTAPTVTPTVTPTVSTPLKAESVSGSDSVAPHRFKKELAAKGLDVELIGVDA